MSDGNLKESSISTEQITLSEGVSPKSQRKQVKWLKIAVALFFITTVVFLILFLIFFLDKDDKDDDDAMTPLEERCNSMQCLHTADYLSRSLDTRTNPCDDFYQFACGGWIDAHPLTSDTIQVTPATMITKTLHTRMREMLLIDDPNAPDAVKKARTFYKSCMNLDLIEAKGVTPLLNLLAQNDTLPIPTLDDNWTEQGWTLNQILEKVERFGYARTNNLIPVSVFVDLKNTSAYVIHVKEPTFDLPQSIYMDRNSSNLLMEEKIYAAIMTSLSANQSTAVSDAVQIVDLEASLAKITLPLVLKRDREATYNKITIKQLSERYPSFEWLGHIRQHFEPTGLTITEDDFVVIDATYYYDRLFGFINSTSKRVLTNYLMWHAILPYTKLLSQPFRQAFRLRTGNVQPEVRWEDCVGEVMSLLPLPASRLYVDKYFAARTKQRVEEMVRDLIVTFKQMVHESDWMSEQTKTAALEKVDAMVYKIGYPDNIKNDTYLNEETKDIVVTADDYFQNSYNIQSITNMDALMHLWKQIDRDEWSISPVIVNAAYNPIFNELLFPAVFLQTPYVSEDFSDVYSYGSVGMFIGHEITHGFDDQGSRYDKDGNMRQWWHPEDKQTFSERSECMVNQYGNYTVAQVNMNVNGRLTLGENIADNGGVKEAYRAYRNLVDRNKEAALKHPVLNYTADQLFFISAAQAWCGSLTDSFMQVIILTDYHTPIKYRVIGPFQNNEDFSRAFNCPVGSYMNPEHKCHVW